MINLLSAAEEIKCECCQKIIKESIVWLELDQRTNSFHNFGNIPEEFNQGGFPFGKYCAKKMILRAKLKEQMFSN